MMFWRHSIIGCLWLTTISWSLSVRCNIVNMSLDARKPDFVAFDQQRPAQPDQCLCYSLSGKKDSCTCQMQNFNSLASRLRLNMIWLQTPKDRFFSWQGIWVCGQQWCRQAYTSMQSDQGLSSLLSGTYYTFTQLRVKFQQSSYSLCSWADWFEFYFVRNHENRFSHDKAHMIIAC